jgi:hypothetical protein
MFFLVIGDKDRRADSGRIIAKSKFKKLSKNGLLRFWREKPAESWLRAPLEAFPRGTSGLHIERLHQAVIDVIVRGPVKPFPFLRWRSEMS